METSFSGRDRHTNPVFGHVLAESPEEQYSPAPSLNALGVRHHGNPGPLLQLPFREKVVYPPK